MSKLPRSEPAHGWKFFSLPNPSVYPKSKPTRSKVKIFLKPSPLIISLFRNQSNIILIFPKTRTICLLAIYLQNKIDQVFAISMRYLFLEKSSLWEIPAYLVHIGFLIVKQTKLNKIEYIFWNEQLSPDFVNKVITSSITIKKLLLHINKLYISKPIFWCCLHSRGNVGPMKQS